MDKVGADAAGSGALRRGLQVLNTLRHASGAPLSVARIASLSGIPRPTVYRLLETLEAEGYAVRGESGKSFAIASLDCSPEDMWPRFVQSMVPKMRRIASTTGNAVYLARREGAALVCLHREIGSYPIQVLSLSVGGRQPLGVGAAGIALLSTLEPRELSAVLRENHDNYAAYGNLQVSTVKLLVENCRMRGFAVVGNYSLEGVLAVGVPLPANRLRAQTAVSVTAPVERMPVARQKEIARLLKAELLSAN